MSDIAPSDRPSFAQAFSGDSGASAADSQTATTPTTDTSSTSSAAPSSADATAPPAPGITDTPTASAAGAPPQDRWPDILNNARAKTRSEVESEFQQKYGWATQVDPQDIAKLQGWSQAYSADPVKWFAQTVADLKAAHPHLAPQLHSEAARVLAAARQTQQPTAPDVDFTPDIPVQDETGRVVAQTFSAEKVLRLIKQEREANAQAVKPLQEERQTRLQQEQHAAQQRELNDTVQAIWEPAITELPHFKENIREIGKVFATIPGDSAQALHRAWWKVVGPQLDAKSRATQLESLQTKAAASTVNPAGAVVASTRRPTSFNDPNLKW